MSRGSPIAVCIEKALLSSHTSTLLKPNKLQTLNDVLQKAHDGGTVDQWYFYLAADDYASAPQEHPQGGDEEGTEALMGPSFKIAIHRP